MMISCENKMPELNLGVPTMGEVEVTDNGSLVFQVKGSLTSYENLVSECGFYVGTSSSMENAEKYQCKLTGKTFATTLFLQGYSRKYYICSYISNGRDERLSEKKTVSIGGLEDYVTFGNINLDAYDRETETATLSTSCSVKEGVNVDSYGILYGTSSELVNSGTSVEIKYPSPSEAAIIRLTGIKIGTKYYICQYLTDNGTPVYQNTIDLNVYVLPTVTLGEISDITASTATVSGIVADEGGAVILEKGIVYAEGTSTPTVESGKVQSMGLNQVIAVTLTGLSPNTSYTVRAYATNTKGTSYSAESKTFTTLVALPQVTTGEASSVTSTSATLNAKIDNDGGLSILEAGFYWSDAPINESSGATKIISSVSGTPFKAQLTNLVSDATYYYRAYAINSLGISYGEEMSLVTSKDLSSDESANCYIVSEAGNYSFRTVKGNSKESVGSVSSCEVLWESFGTATTPSIGDLIKSVSYFNGYIGFETATTFREGNAVIAAKDANGNILWSWHIWLTDQPQGQTYNNGAGVLMDRNLGATSATKGDVGALGLLYQWGRKDPFLGSSSISSNTQAKSTITWPSSVSSSSSTGTIAYATAHPTTFITSNSNNYDWYYSSGSSTDNTRWQSSKTVYDPCPAGWRVPDGGSNGVWSKAFDTSSSWETSSNWNSTNKGMDFSKTDKKLGSSGPIWYPASGFRGGSSLIFVGSRGFYWSVSPNGYHAYDLSFNSNGYVNPAIDDCRYFGQSVRCVQE